MNLNWAIALAEAPESKIPVITFFSGNRAANGDYQETFNGSHFIIDLGAHQGETIVGFTKYCAYYKLTNKYSISSYEASRQAQIWGPLTASALTVSHEYSSIFIANLAVSSTTGFLKFRDDGSAGSSLHEEKPLNDSMENTLVPTLSIIDILDQVPNNIESLILKLNIEGAEYEVLEELIRRPQYLSKVTELWLDFHGFQFQDKWKYLEKELKYMKVFKELKIPCYDIDLMTGYFKGYDKYPPVKTLIQFEDIVKAYTE